MKKYIEYIRVSTDKQNDSGLGLEAQTNSIQSYVKSVKGEVIQSFKEVVSGTRKERIKFNSNLSLSQLLANRPVLLQAIEQCRKQKAILIVKEYTRLTRSKLVIEWLMKMNLTFVCADSPNDDPQIISIKVGFGEEEAKKIGERTKAALEVKRNNTGEWRKGNILFNKGTASKEGIRRIKELANNNPANKIAAELICPKLLEGWTLQRIADYLNELGHSTVKGSTFTTVQVSRIAVRYCLQ